MGTRDSQTLAADVLDGRAMDGVNGRAIVVDGRDPALNGRPFAVRGKAGRYNASDYPFAYPGPPFANARYGQERPGSRRGPADLF